MTIASKFGAGYDSNRAKLRTIALPLGDSEFALKLRLPVKREMEEMTEAIASPPKERIDAIYTRLADPMRQLIKDSGDDFLAALNSEKQSVIIKDDDVIIDGNSVRQVAMLSAMWEIKVERYFHLLQTETGEEITESFDEISAEFPDSIIKDIVQTIEDTIKPDYKNTKKN
jgi:hypothetical protein